MASIAPAAHHILGVVPAKALGHAHIFEGPSYCDSAEVFEAVFEGDWPWWLRRWIAIPTSEAADNPCGPSEGLRRMRAFERCALGLKVLVESSERCDLIFIEGKLSPLLAAAIARLPELDGDDRRFGRDGDELEEAIGGGELSGFGLEVRGVQHAEKLSVKPTPPVPIIDS